MQPLEYIAIGVLIAGGIIIALAMFSPEPPPPIPLKVRTFDAGIPHKPYGMDIHQAWKYYADGSRSLWHQEINGVVTIENGMDVAVAGKEDSLWAYLEEAATKRGRLDSL